MRFHGRSDRIVDGHGSSVFTQNREMAERWAKDEARAGFKSEVWCLQEVFLIGFEPPAPPAQVASPPVSPVSLCKHGHDLKGRPQCQICGEFAND